MYYTTFYKLIQEHFASSHPNHAEGVYIIRNLLRYIINAEHCISSSRRKNARWRVMIYSPKGADDMHRTSRGASFVID